MSINRHSNTCGAFSFFPQFPAEGSKRIKTRFMLNWREIPDGVSRVNLKI